MSLPILNNNKRENDISRYMEDLVIKQHAGTVERNEKSKSVPVFAQKKPTPPKSMNEENEDAKLQRRGIHTINKDRKGQNKVTFRK